MRISRGSNWMDANLSKDPVEISIVNKILSNINHKHEYIINNSGGWNNNLIITFDEPKIFDKMKFNMHEYSPAEIRYFLRIYQFQYYWGEDEDIYMVQWISRQQSSKPLFFDSETYICRDLFALFDLLDDFQDFLSDKSEDYFKTDYPSF